MCACCAQLRERWQPPTDDPEWRNLALAKGLVPSLLSQAAARAAEPLAHITRTLVQLEVIDHDVGQTALSNYLKNCLAKSKGISGPSYNPANGSHTLHRHIAAATCGGQRTHRVMRHSGRWPRMQTDRGMCVVYMLMSALPQNGGDI